jgi:hypothetical protein
MDGIGDALNLQIASARTILRRPIRAADRSSSASATSATDRRIKAAASRLREQLSEFAQGWTAPVPKLWKDRHPFFYAVILLLIGAAIGWGGSEARRLLPDPTPSSPAAVPTDRPA